MATTVNVETIMQHLRGHSFVKSLRIGVVLFIGLQLIVGCALPKRIDMHPPQPVGDWNTILGLQAEDSVVVQLKTGPAVKGRFMRADMESLTMKVARNQESVIPRQSVHRVEHHISDGLLNGILLGAGIGFLSGFLGEGLSFHVIGGSNGFPDAVSMGMGTLGAIVGAPTGLLADKLMKKKRIIYQTSP